MNVAAPARRAARLAAALDPASIAIIGASDNPNKVGGRPLVYLSRFGYRGRIYPINAARDQRPGRASLSGSGARFPRRPTSRSWRCRRRRRRTRCARAPPAASRSAIVMASGFGETPNPERTSERGGAWWRTPAQRRHAAGRPEFAGPREFRHRRRRQLLDDVRRGRAGRRPGRDRQSERRDERGAVRPAARPRHRHPARARDGQRRRRHARRAGPRGRARSRRPPGAALHRVDPRSGAARAGGGGSARARCAHRRGEVGPDRARRRRRRDRTPAHSPATTSVVDAFFREPWHLARARHARSGAHRGALSEGLAAARPRARDRQQLGRQRGDGGRHRGRRSDCRSRTSPTPHAKALAAELPDFASVANPIDITAALLTNSRLFGNLLPILAREQTADLFLLAIPVAGEGYDVPLFARDAAAFAAATGEPVVVAAPQDTVAARFRAAGLPTFANQTDAIAALAQLVSHSALMRARRHPAAVKMPVQLPDGTGPLLNEADSLAFLAAHGVPVVDHVLCRSEKHARGAFARFGGPVVLKACSSDAPHKSDLGLVVLNVSTEADVAAAYRALSARLAELGLRDEGILVAPMVRGRYEVALGARIDPLFGPTVMVSDGGRYVEALPDLALLLPPFDASDARAAWRGLRMSPLFDGVRGEPALDLEALCAATVRLRTDRHQRRRTVVVDRRQSRDGRRRRRRRRHRRRAGRARRGALKPSWRASSSSSRLIARPVS